MQKIKLTEEQLERVMGMIIKEQSDFFENPFKNKAQGDAFRAWVNDTYPDFAKEIQLSRSGRFNNSYINKALKQTVKLSNGKTTSMMTWYMSKNPNWAAGKTEVKPKPTPKPPKKDDSAKKITPPKKDDGAKKITPVLNQEDINSYPQCVRAFGKPVRMKTSFIERVFDKFFGDGSSTTHVIPGTNFYEKYYFTADGKYILFKDKSKKAGTYGCQNGKLTLDIASTANKKSTLTSGKYKYSPRVDAEVKHIQNRGLDKSPFFVYDPKDNLIYLFDTGSKYVASTAVVDGKDAQGKASDSKIFTVGDWCKTMGMTDTPFKCTNPKTKKQVAPTYKILDNIYTKFIPKGIYTINGLQMHEGYAGGASGNNTWRMTPLKLDGTITASSVQGKTTSMALHGVPSSRLTASNDLLKLLKSDINGGKVPTEYLQAAKTIANANLSYGCVGLPASFVDSQKVQAILRKGNVQVFAMGEGSDMLVKNDQPNTGETNVA